MGQERTTVLLTLILSAILLISQLTGCRDETEADRETVAEEVPGGYTVVEVSDGGRVSGSVSIAETPPDLPGFDEANPEGVCRGVLDNNRLEVGSDGGVAWGVVWIEGVTSGKPFPEDPPVIDQSGCRYSPHVVVAPVGRSVTIRNSDPTAHNVRIEEGSGLIVMNATQAKQGDVDEFDVGSSGPKLVGCDYHPWMNAYIFGVESPYATVTGPDGRYEITDIPPGRYRLHLWVNGFIPEPRLDNNGRLVRYRYSPATEITREIEISPSARISEDFTLTAENDA